MKQLVIIVAGLWVAASSDPASGWAHADRFGGGGTFHAPGSGETTRTNAWGGTATHYAGYGTVGTSAYGTTAYHSPYYGTTAVYPGYHPPTTVNYYSSGCYNCGGWSTAGAAAAGLVVGAAVATAATTSANAANTTNAYNAGYAAGASNTMYTMGGIYPTLPAGCVTPSVSGVTYYLCGTNWFLPSYGANGVYYRVVAAP